MVNQKDILARLQAGESADAIAQEMVDMLNAANAEFTKAQEAATQKQAKIEAVEEIGELIKDFILDFYPDSAVAEMIEDQELDATEIIEAVDAAFVQLDAEVRKLKQLESMFGGLLAQLEKDGAPVGTNPTVSGKIEPNPDALGAFLKANGLA